MNSVSDTATRSEPRSKYVIDRPNQLPSKDRQEEINLMTTMNVISSLPNSKAWPFKIGIPLITLSIGATAIYVNSHFRKSLLLLHNLKFSSYIGMVIVPCCTGTIAFLQMISNDIIQRRTKCSVCLQTRAALIQTVAGVAYPLILAPLISFPTAGAIEGSYMPNVWKKPKEVVAYSFEVMKPMWPKLRVITLCHIVLAMGITHFQFDYFHSKILPYVTTGSVEKTGGGIETTGGNIEKTGAS